MVESPTKELEGSEVTTPVNYNLSVPELGAILRHKFVLSNERNKWVSMEEAISDFIQERQVENDDPRILNKYFTSYYNKFKAEQTKEDYLLQEEQILKILRELQQNNPTLTKRDAIYTWLISKAPEWRRKRDSFEGVFGDKFERIFVPTVHNTGIINTAINNLCSHYCDVFGYQKNTEDHDFTLQNKPYQDLKRRIILLGQEIRINPDSSLELLVIGDQCKEAKHDAEKGLSASVLLLETNREEAE